MTRSQMAFIRGVCGRVGMIRSPSDLNTSLNAVQQMCRHVHICCTFHVGRLGTGDGPTRKLGIVMECATDAEATAIARKTAQSCAITGLAPCGVSKTKHRRPGYETASSRHCQQGSRIVSAASARPRTRLACTRGGQLLSFLQPELSQGRARFDRSSACPFRWSGEFFGGLSNTGPLVVRASRTGNDQAVRRAANGSCSR